MRCPVCGSDNREPVTDCQVCGTPLTSPDPGPQANLNPSLTLTLFKAAVGPVNSAHYAKTFGIFEARGKTQLGWNWLALVSTLGWMGFRRMWTQALLYAGLATLAALLLYGVLPSVLGYSEDLIWSASVAYALLIWVGPALMADGLYYRHCTRLVSAALAEGKDIAQARERLAAMAPGKPRLRVVVMLVLLCWLALAGVGLTLGSSWADQRSNSLSAAVPPPQAKRVSVGAVAPAASGPVVAASTAALVASAPAVVAASAPLIKASADSTLVAPAGRPSSSVLVVPIVMPVWVPVALPMPYAIPAGPGGTRTSPSPSAAPINSSSGAKSTSSVLPAAPPSGASRSAVAAIAVAPALPVLPASRSASTVSKPKATDLPPKAPVPPLPAPVASPAATTDVTYMLVVGIFAQADNVRRASERLRQAGLSAHTDTLHGSRGDMTRVWVGPYDSAASAQANVADVVKLGLPATVGKR